MVQPNGNLWMEVLILGNLLSAAIQNSIHSPWVEQISLCGNIIWYMTALCFALFCQSRVLSDFEFLQIRLLDWFARLDFFQACDPRNYMDLVHGILLLVQNRYSRDSSCCDSELLIADICGIVDDILHLPFWDSSWVRHVFAPTSRSFAGVSSLHIWVWFPKSAYSPQKS